MSSQQDKEEVLPLSAKNSVDTVEDLALLRATSGSGGRQARWSPRDAAAAAATTTAAAGDVVPQHIRVKNRRKRYLELHPEYFGSSLELADPLLYDRLIRRFQSASERESEGRKKGYSGVLEADLYRGEAKLNALRNPDPNASIVYRRGEGGEILEEEKDEIPATKQEGMQRWREEMERRFLEGRDADFEYEVVDLGEEFDDVREEERGAEEIWFEEESPDWVDEGLLLVDHDGSTGGGERKLQGETGIQDF